MVGEWLFCEWRHKWSSFSSILAHVAWPRAQPLGRSISLKFSLETTLESESFEPLIDFSAFMVQKLWTKIYKLISWLIKYFYCFRSWNQNYVFNFEPNVFYGSIFFNWKKNFEKEKYFCGLVCGFFVSDVIS